MTAGPAANQPLIKIRHYMAFQMREGKRHVCYVQLKIYPMWNLSPPPPLPWRSITIWAWLAARTENQYHKLGEKTALWVELKKGCLSDLLVPATSIVGFVFTSLYFLFQGNQGLVRVKDFLKKETDSVVQHSAEVQNDFSYGLSLALVTWPCDLT